nr:RNA-directed DNA polymerase, eukaryota [Tanacetum cinerariifolium]
MPAAPSNSTGFRQPKAQDHAGSYVNVVNGSFTGVVADDSCVVERDLSKYAMGKVKDVNSIPNLRTLLMDEGFFDVKLMYLGGMWVMFEFDKVDTKVNMMQHIGVKSLFHVIQDAVHDFVSDERIVWVDIEGIPLNVWSRETFMRIAHSPFSEEVSGDDSESDVEEVSETIFGDNSSYPNNNSDEMGKQHFEDPFKIYDILKKQIGGEMREVSSSLSHLPGFTPEVSEIRKENDQDAEEFPSLVNAKYVSTLIGRWNGETIILGNFNEVRSIDERRGSCFNPSSARVFDHFISSSGLVDVKLERMIRFKKKLQDLKAIIRCWVKDKRMHRSGEKSSIKNELSDIDKEFDRRVVSDNNLFRHLELQRKLHDINQMEAKDSFQKSKIKWAIEGGRELEILPWFMLNFPFNKRLSDMQAVDLERNVSRDQIRLAVWNYGENKSPGPDGYTLFFRKYWNIVVDEGLCKGVHLQGSISISHLFYADDAMFIGEWSDANLKGIVNILQWFFLASGLKINIHKRSVGSGNSS